MPPFKQDKSKSHGDNLTSVCAACWRKKGSLQAVTESVADLICQYVYTEYKRDNGIHPSVICDGCRKTLRDIREVQMNKYYIKFFLIYIYVLFSEPSESKRSFTTYSRL